MVHQKCIIIVINFRLEFKKEGLSSGIKKMFADESERRIVPSTRMEVFQLRMRLSHPAIRLIELWYICYISQVRNR